LYRPNAYELYVQYFLTDIGNNSELNDEAKEEAGLTSPFQIENFTYNNSAVVDVLFSYLQRTQFQGITVGYMACHLH